MSSLHQSIEGTVRGHRETTQRLNVRELIDNQSIQSSIFEDGDANQKECKTATISQHHDDSKEADEKVDFVDVKADLHKPNQAETQNAIGRKHVCEPVLNTTKHQLNRNWPHLYIQDNFVVQNHHGADQSGVAPPTSGAHVPTKVVRPSKESLTLSGL